MIDYWKCEAYDFMNRGKLLRIAMEDIYFLTGMTLRGYVVKLKGKGSNGLTITKYTALYFLANT
jgi:hypothetical protein